MLYLPLGPLKTTAARTKIHPSRIISQKLERAVLNAGRPAVTAVLCWLAVKKSDENRISLYQNADDCSAANPGKSAECTTAYNNALKEAERTAPKYAATKIASLSLAKRHASATCTGWHGTGKSGAGSANPAAVSMCRLWQVT